MKNPQQSKFFNDLSDKALTDKDASKGSSMEMANNKPAPRIPLHINVEFRKSYARQPDQGILKNISLSGAFLHSQSEKFHQGEKVNLEFNVSGRQRQIQATVVWTNDFGAGVQFNHFNNRDRQIIDDLMYFVESKRTSSRDVLGVILERMEKEG